MTLKMIRLAVMDFNDFDGDTVSYHGLDEFYDDKVSCHGLY